MSAKSNSSVVLGLLLVAVSPARAQKSQEFDPDRHYPLGAVESRVQSCANPVPSPGWLAAFDDFRCDLTGPINHIYWWGVILPENNVAQLDKRYFISIRVDSGGPCEDAAGAGCGPASLTHPDTRTWCVDPSWQDTGSLDCLGRRIYRFSASLSPPFEQIQGYHYWVQVSEIDDESSTPGVEDFRWKSTEPFQHCTAVQASPAAGVICPIGDDCPTLPPCDLTFKLSEVSINGDILIGQIIDPDTLLNPRFFIGQLRPAFAPISSPPIKSVCFKPDTDGKYHLGLNVPDGQYQLTLIGMGTDRPTRQLTIQNRVASGVDFSGLQVGDLNNDGAINGSDIPPLIDGCLQP